MLLTWNSFSQDCVYVHYDVKEGLAGSTVYDAVQDKDGFIWFATEGGVSRFDGTNFKKFSTAEGLPETEVLRLYADSKGRVWMAPFKNTICYYYNGRIYNQDNDSVLKRLKLSAITVQIKEDLDGNIAINTGLDIFILNPDSSDKKIIHLQPEARFPFISLVETAKIRHGFVMFMNDSLHTIIGGKITFLQKAKPYCSFELKSDVDSNLFRAIGKAKSYIGSGYTVNNDRMLFINTQNGAYLVDTFTNKRIDEVFLPGKPITHTLIDNEKNIWFTTNGEGVYKLASREVRLLRLANIDRQEIFSLEKYEGRIVAGGNFGNLYTVKSPSLLQTSEFARYFTSSPNQAGAHRVTALKRVQNGDLVLGFDAMLAKQSPKGIKIAYIYPVKSIDEIDSATILVSTGRGAVTVSLSDFKVKDTVWPYRAMTACYYNHSYYLGTLSGLCIKTVDGKVNFPGDSFPAFRQRISSFAKTPDGNLWIATYGAGLVCMKNEKIIWHLTTANGLTSNICRTLFVQNNFLWVGTDKGVNKVDMSKPGSPIARYTMADGLPSDFINAIYADDNKIYVGSPAGLVYFNEFNVSNYSAYAKCNLKVLDISFSNKSREESSYYQLPFMDNSMKISFVAISFRSAGDILYRYRLKGLRRTWDSTRQTVIEYPSLPPGDYELELMAINKFGVESNHVNIPFTIETPFWQSLWFQILVIAIAIVITWILVAWRFRVTRSQEREKTALQQRMSDLEQLALRSQMNPHFIFNCLNSIQNFIINNKLETSNWYLTEFAHLIRQTLDNSDKGTISINNEIQYLKRYLELEKMRFGNSFEYSIEADPGIDRDSVRIPPMILQPYVENSIRHGIRYKKGKEGLIQVRFKQNGRELLCIVQDNGIGRKKAQELKSQIHVEYQSRGMSLTAERINLLNRHFTEPITIEITDLGENTGTGTRVVIHFPFNNLYKLK